MEARLAAAEGELERLTAVQEEPSRVADITLLLGDLAARATRAVDELEKAPASGDARRARAQIKAHVGTVMVEADEGEIRLYSDKGAMAAAFREQWTAMQVCVVAGAGYGPSLAFRNRSESSSRVVFGAEPRHLID
ncbi:MAG: hypothetical protein ACYCT1_15995 [Steroidobacteraceae bacterium]